MGCAQQEKLTLSVRNMMGRQEFGAPATIHSRLKSMREKGWITLADTHDARRKQVELAPAALLHFDRLSQCMWRAASSSN
jgi:SOS-response transcriptional repressor LexA